MPDAPAPGVLYLVATPIGNLEDITARALRVLREVNLIAAEDTRQTRKLLSHLGIAGKPVDALHAHSSDRDVARLVELRAGGASIALVSDAGTPLVSDPTSSRFNPSARLTIGKRISNRAYLTFSRSISSTSDQIILLEYDQTDRVSWILTRNEDDSYALDIRVRKEF
jgi:hypothetical protein